MAAQCDTCNGIHESDPTIYRLKFIEKYGVEEYGVLYRLAYQGAKQSDYQLKQLIKELENIWMTEKDEDGFVNVDTEKNSWNLALEELKNKIGEV